MSDTIKCYSCSASLHIGDQYSEDGCPCCGGEINSPEQRQVQVELEQLAKEQDPKEIF